MPRLWLSLSLAPLFLTSPTAAGAPIDFNRDIRPLLSENCYHCHGPDAAERKAGLRLDEENGAKEVRDGTAAVVPGKIDQSTLIERIFSTDPDEVMPTPKSNRHLTEPQKQLLKQWIEEGAKWGRHWSFERVERPAVPAGDARHPIDAFVRAKLPEKKLNPAPPADPATLLRRLHLDLTGLPPRPEDAALFLHESSGDPEAAYSRQVEKLMASPAFGERWCWDWLDAARYADTNGYQGDPERTMWPWRDWVAKVINENMPYDQFTLWQMAGDLLPNATVEQKMATGFHRNHMINGEGGRIFEETRVENVMDRVETTGTVFMGLTIGCCRCHDHKFDPLSQKDYYAMYDFFNQMNDDGKRRTGQSPPVLDVSSPGEYEQVAAAQKRLEKIVAEVEAFELKRFPRPPGKTLADTEAINLPGNLPQYIAKTEPKNRSVDALLEAYSYFKKREPAYGEVLGKHQRAARELSAANVSISKVMILDTIPTRRDTFVLDKGAYDKPTATKVTAAIPAVFAPPGPPPPPPVKLAADGRPMLVTTFIGTLPLALPVAVPPPPAGPPKTRLDLAAWLVSRDNPLTARVTVNRFWQAFFGVGLVKTAEDFGVQGETPMHQDLLDWLAAEFMESGWDVKALMRLIVTSATYRQSSAMTPQAREADPENRWLARGPRFRLPSWMIRDQALAVSGLLNPKVGGPGVLPYQPEGIWEEATFGKKTYVQSHGAALYRRTLYTFWRRIVGPTTLFDNASRQMCTVKTVRTNTPLHALVTLNDPTFVEAARVLAQQILLRPGDDASRLRDAFQRVTCRPPAQAELAILQKQLARLRDQQAQEPEAAVKLLAVGESPRDENLPAQEHATWTSLCLLLLNLDEVLTKE